jgi:tetratricopeptide (TPR) repeat protein
MNPQPAFPAPARARRASPCLGMLLVLLLPALAATATLPPATLIGKGEDALAANLPEIAARHFREGLAAKPDAAEASRIRLLLAEALVRGERPEEALDILSKRGMKELPGSVLWKGFALAALGRNEEAIAALTSSAAADDPQAILTTANLLLAEGRTEEALQRIAPASSRATDPAAKQGLPPRVSILIEQGRHAEARALLPLPADPASPQIPPAERLLHGRLLRIEGNAEQAATVLKSLLDPRNTPGPVLHRAAVELTDALLATGNEQEAASFLTGFIDTHPESPQLDALFERLHTLLAARPTDASLLAKLGRWTAGTPEPAPGPVADGDSGAASALPPGTTRDRRLARALLAKARALLAANQGTSTGQARLLLAKLISISPEPGLADEALLLFARQPLSSQAPLSPAEIATILRERVAPRELVGKADFLAAVDAAGKGDPENAAAGFDAAAELLTGRPADIARTNATLTRLIANPSAVDPAKPDAATAQAREALASLDSPDLKLKVAEALPDPGERRAALEAFLTDHPKHPRAIDARIAAAEAALDGLKPDVSFAKAQLDTIAAGSQSPDKPADSPRALRVRMRIDDATGNAEAAVSGARDFLKRFPREPGAEEVRLLLGRNLSASGNFNDARMVFEQLASSGTNPAHTQTCWLMAARAASQVPTPQSRQEAIGLYDKAITAAGPVAALARLEKARLLIDANRLEEAETMLDPWRASLKPQDPLRIPTGFLLAEARQARGPSDRKSATEALSVLDSMLAESGAQAPIRNRIQYLRGKILEDCPAADGSPRTEEALAAFYSVLETRTTPSEWHYFELCGFRALALLEKAGRWSAAARCADRIASFKGPRAGEARARADRIRLEQMIWDD